MDYYAIGQRIRKIRKAYGLSQEELAEKIGISVTHMSHIETGNTKLSLPVFVDLAAALEIRTDDLLYDETTAERSSAVEEIVRILGTCTTQQLKIMEDVLRATRVSLKKYL
jgi:transcriptional regulator with XRE-family HTH domain